MWEMNLNYNNTWDKVIKGQCNVQNCQKLWPVFIFQSKYAEYNCEFFSDNSDKDSLWIVGCY